MIPLFFRFLGVGHAAELHVCQGVDSPDCADPGAYIDSDPLDPALQRAIDDAVDGDTIVVHAGFYIGPYFVVGKEIDIVRANPNDAPLLTAEDTSQTTFRVDGGATVTLEGLSFTAPFSRALTAQGTGTSVLARDCFFATIARRTRGSAILVEEGASVEIEDCDFSEGTATIAGGQIHADDSTLVLRRSTFTDGVAGSSGGAVAVSSSFAGASSLTIEDCEFVGARSYATGGAVHISGDVATTITRSTFTDCSADAGGALFAESFQGARITIEECAFSGNVATDGPGGAALVMSGSASVLRSTFTANVAHGVGMIGGGIAADDPAALTLAGDSFCANDADGGGDAVGYADLEVAGVVELPLGPADGFHWTNNLFVDNGALGLGGAVLVDPAQPSRIAHSTFLGNGGGALTTGVASEVVALEDALVAYNLGQPDLSARVTVLNSVWFANLGDGRVPAGGLVADPRLYAYSHNAECTNDDLGYRSDTDTDDHPLYAGGSDGSDIGWYGGTDAPDEATVDADGDGAADVYDCDDGRVDVNPDAVDLPYDGLDADCDGWSDFDADRDGYGDLRFGGNDCDDADATVHPQAVDLIANGVDDDCVGGDDVDGDDDGFPFSSDCDDTDPLTNPGQREDDGPVDRDCEHGGFRVGALRPAGCATAPGPAALWLLVLVSARRRSRVRR